MGHTVRLPTGFGSGNAEARVQQDTKEERYNDMKKRLSSLLFLAALLVGLLSVPAGAKYGSSYDYDETDAAQVTVTVTLAYNGVPLYGNNSEETPLAHLDVTVPYFSLEPYGLSDYDRYPARVITEGVEKPIVFYDRNKDVIKRPTALHAILWLLERYYYGLSEDECGKGAACTQKYFGRYSGKMYDLNGGEYPNGQAGLAVGGSPTSLYMTEFWGHNYNLMYFRNHAYPLAYDGWGSTADYQLLSDGDTLDFGLFSNSDFFSGGAFACFGQDTYTVDTGQPLRVLMQQRSTGQPVSGGSAGFTPSTGLTAAVYDAYWQPVKDATLTPAGEDGWYTVTFPRAGTYYLLGRDPNWGKNDANIAPATAKVVVTEPQQAGLAHTDVQQGSGGVQLRCVLETPGGQLIAALFRDGWLITTSLLDVTAAGAQTLTLPSGGDTVKLFRVLDGAAPEAAFTGKLGG